jgi:hypothetical protein
MDAKEAENVILMDSVFAEEDARQEAFGFAAAKRDLEATNNAERETAIALCAYRCQTLGEARVKAEYVAANLADIDGLHHDQVKALLGSFADKAVS